MLEQWSYDDLKSVPWLGDARIKEFYDKYRLVKNQVLDQLPREAAQIRMFYDKIKTSKVLQIDLREFDRYDEDDPRRTLKFLERAVERIIARRRMDDARTKQEQRLTEAIGADTGLQGGGGRTEPGAAGATGRGR